MSSAVRISPDSHERLRQIAEDEGVTLTEALDRAIEAYRRQRMLRDVNQAYTALRQDPKKWSEEEADRAAMEGSVSDGLDEDE